MDYTSIPFITKDTIHCLTDSTYSSHQPSHSPLLLPYVP